MITQARARQYPKQAGVTLKPGAIDSIDHWTSDSATLRSRPVQLTTLNVTLSLSRTRPNSLTQQTRAVVQNQGAFSKRAGVAEALDLRAR
jgi:hypothetical protein